ncbi:MAG TPA: hypothetical protein VK932_12015, partial [Kofleriaceae bacterium]|nr:hypothetical protein [Kofleriaceae bacterium]
DKRPGLVGLPDFTTQQICPEELGVQPAELTNAAPELWYVRIMFDELLDPTIERLVPVLDEMGNETGVFNGTLRESQPVILQCEVAGSSGAMQFTDVPYDGYYSPSGNAVTWPLGPSLVIKPLDPTTIPVNTRCRVEIDGDKVRDKSGLPVPPDQRGPFTFKIAPAEIISISPGPGERVNAEFGGVDLTFNVEVDASSINDTMYSFTPEMTNTGVFQYAASGVFIYGDMLDSKAYEFEIAEGTTIKDKCGKESTLHGDNLATEFSTTALSLVNIVPFQGPGAIPSRKIRINFNQIMDRSTLIEGEDYEWVGEQPELIGTPTPPPFVYDSADPSVIIVNGIYKLGTNYQFKLKAGAKIKDCPSLATVGNCSTSPGELTIAEEQLINITTATAISNTSISIGAGSTSPRSRSITTISGAGGQTIHKVADNENIFVRFAFNQDMVGSTLEASEISLTKSDGTPTGVSFPADTGTGTTSVTTFNVGALPAGSYKFTLKQGATINDRLSTPNTYTQGSNREFSFNVVVDPPSPPFSCLKAP